MTASPMRARRRVRTNLDFSPSGLLSAFHQERQKLKDLGITFKVHEESEVWANLTGGGKQGVSYDGLTIGKLDFDLEKLFGWSGAEFLVEAFDIHAHGPSRNFVGNLQLVSKHRGDAERQAVRPLARSVAARQQAVRQVRPRGRQMTR